MVNRPTKRILIVEDRASLRRMMEHALNAAGYDVHAAADGTAAIERLAAERFDLVLTDLKMPGASGLEVVAACRRQQPEVPIVVLTAFGTVASAVEAMKLGANDFLEKPVELDDLEALVGELLSTEEPPEVLEIPGAPALVGRDPTFRAALRLLRKVAPTESTVLLTGETGTGKELFAQALHALSKRAGGPFVAVNCAAIPEGLVESELFGHEKGAFTGASRLQRGRFELAGAGTLFLDEIGEIDLAIQGKILRALEERQIERIGGGHARSVDVRVVAATNRDLRSMAERGEFRQDLFFRLDVFPIELPPLRARRRDIGPLAIHLLARVAKRTGLDAPILEKGAIATLAEQPWPGNVRQLANVLERAAILAENGVVGAEDVESLLGPVVEKGERLEIREALVAARGDKKRAAEALGMSLRSLQRKVRELGLEGVEYRDL